MSEARNPAVGPVSSPADRPCVSRGGANGALAEACEAHEKGGPWPPLVREFLDTTLAEMPDVVGLSRIISSQLPVRVLLGRLPRAEHGLPVLFGESCFAYAAEHFLRWNPESASLAGEGEDALKQYLTDPTPREGA